MTHIYRMYKENPELLLAGS